MKKEDTVLVCRFNWQGKVTLVQSFLEGIKNEVGEVIVLTELSSAPSPIAIFADTIVVNYDKMGICADIPTGRISDYIFFGQIRIKDNEGEEIIAYRWELTYNIKQKKFWGKLFEIFASKRLFLEHFNEQFDERLRQAIFSEKMLILARKKIILI